MPAAMISEVWGYVTNKHEKIEKVALQITNGVYPQEDVTLVSHIIGLLGQRLWFYRKTNGYSNKLKINYTLFIFSMDCNEIVRSGRYTKIIKRTWRF